MNEIQTIKWTHKQDVVIHINPAKRKQIVRTFSVVAMVTFILFLLGINGGPVEQWAERHKHQIERDQLEPMMRTLAAEGKPDAIIWIAKNFPGTETDQLKTLAARGNGEAMMEMARRMWGTNEIEAKKLISQAAAVGFVPAVEWQLRQK